MDTIKILPSVFGGDSPPIAPASAQEMEGKTRKYPGEAASPLSIRQLADEYRTAAHSLFAQRRKRKPLSLAPCRLSAIHAVELYLNAFLLYRGRDASSVRGLQHNLAAHADLAKEAGLVLKKLTTRHLHAINTNREYLVSRYSPELTATHSNISRLLATLDEVGNKVTKAVAT